MPYSLWWHAQETPEREKPTELRAQGVADRGFGHQRTDLQNKVGILALVSHSKITPKCRHLRQQS